MANCSTTTPSQSLDAEWPNIFRSGSLSSLIMDSGKRSWADGGLLWLQAVLYPDGRKPADEDVRSRLDGSTEQRNSPRWDNRLFSPDAGDQKNKSLRVT
jgi:hypothetical protein